jgi:hypothetical protein
MPAHDRHRGFQMALAAIAFEHLHRRASCAGTEIPVAVKVCIMQTTTLVLLFTYTQFAGFQAGRRRNSSRRRAGVR